MVQELQHKLLPLLIVAEPTGWILLSKFAPSALGGIQALSQYLVYSVGKSSVCYSTSILRVWCITLIQSYQVINPASLFREWSVLKTTIQYKKLLINFGQLLLYTIQLAHDLLELGLIFASSFVKSGQSSLSPSPPCNQPVAVLTMAKYYFDVLGIIIWEPKEEIIFISSALVRGNNFLDFAVAPFS